MVPFSCGLKSKQEVTRALATYDESKGKSYQGFLTSVSGSYCSNLSFSLLIRVGLKHSSFYSFCLAA